MAMSNWITIPDVSGVTAGAGDVLSGKVIVDKNGNKIVGDMPDWDGVPSHINNRRLNNGRYEVAVEYGRHGCYWAKNSYEYIELNELASDIGLTSDKLISGTTVCGVSGSIPNKSGTTVDASAVTSDADYTYLTVPANGYYDTSSKIRTVSNNVINPSWSTKDYEPSSASYIVTTGKYYLVARTTLSGDGTSSYLSADSLSGCEVMNYIRLRSSKSGNYQARSVIFIVKATSSTITTSNGKIVCVPLQ